jgi:hypothetical protein
VDTQNRPLIDSMGNVLDDITQQQILALGRLGCSLRRIDLPSVHVPSRQARERKTMCGMREALVGARTKLVNTVGGWLRAERRCPRGGELSTFAARAAERSDASGGPTKSRNAAATGRRAGARASSPASCMGDGSIVKKHYRGEGGILDTEVVIGKKNADIVPDVHKGAAEERVRPVPAPADPKFFDDEPRQGRRSVAMLTTVELTGSNPRPLPIVVRRLPWHGASRGKGSNGR